MSSVLAEISKLFQEGKRSGVWRELGEVWDSVTMPPEASALRWQMDVYPPHLIAKTAVLDFIEPVSPESVGYNGFERDSWTASWCQPYPLVDAALLRSLRGVTIVSEDMGQGVGDWMHIEFKIDYGVMLER